MSTTPDPAADAVDCHLLVSVDTAVASHSCDHTSSNACITRMRQEDIGIEKVYDDCVEAQHALIAAANKFLKKVKQPPMDIDTKYNWTTVQKSVEKACLALDHAAAKDKDVTGSTGKLKRGFQGLCRNAGSGKLFTAMIPNDSFGSVLCGGLNIIFAALEQTGTHREAVYKALVRLPQIIDNFDEYIKILPDDIGLHQRTARLYSEVCLTLEHILTWFAMSSFRVGTKRLLNPVCHSDKLNERMAEVNLAAQDFKAYASRLIFQRQEDIFNMQNSASHDQQTMARHVREMDSNLQWLVERSNLYDGIQTKLLERLQPFLQGEMRRLISQQHSSVLSDAELYEVPDASNVTAESILKTFLYGKGLREKDLQTIFNLGNFTSPNRPDPARVRAIHNNAQLRAWLTVDMPAALLLSGGTDPFCSSTSFAVAMLVSSLLRDHSFPLRSVHVRSSPVVIILAYFCDQHRDYRRDVAGSSSELAMSLLLQLVDRYRMFDAADLAACVNETDPEDIESIGSSFGRLVSRLPSSAIVFLFVDGLYFFTTPLERQHQTLEVIQQLLIVFRSEHTATLKMLFSSPVSSKFAADLFADDEIVNMPAFIPALQDTSYYLSGFAV